MPKQGGCRAPGGSKAEARQRQGENQSAPAAGCPPPRVTPDTRTPMPPREAVGVGACSGEPPNSCGSPGLALTMMPMPHDLSVPGLPQAPHERDGGAAAALYRGRPRRGGAVRPARDTAVPWHTSASTAHICAQVPRRGRAARQPDGRIDGSSIPPGSPAPCLAGTKGETGIPFRKGKGGISLVVLCLPVLTEILPPRGRAGTSPLGVLLVGGTIQALAGTG